MSVDDRTILGVFIRCNLTCSDMKCSECHDLNNNLIGADDYSCPVSYIREEYKDFLVNFSDAMLGINNKPINTDEIMDIFYNSL